MKKIIYTFLLLVVLGFIGTLIFAWLPTSTPQIDAKDTDFTSPGLVARGEYLATMGDCTSCHTERRGQLFAGGLPLESPVGIIYSTNITPDKVTGIGHYSLDDFDRAVRHGIDAKGGSLYPAMPYPSFSYITDEDVIALYAYFMNGVKPVNQANNANGISWPLSMRWPLAIWRKVISPTAEPFNGDQQYSDPQIARGAYIVQGLGHCGACHTPRNIFMSEVALNESNDSYLSGGQIIDGWYATSLRNGPDGLGNWSITDIVSTLKTGRNESYAVVGDGMNDVVRFSTRFMTDEDLLAVAAYLKSLPSVHISANVGYDAQAAAQTIELSAAQLDDYNLYRLNCSSCHGLEGQGIKGVIPALSGNPTVLTEDPTSVIRIILNGYDAPQFDSALLPMRMPGFGEQLSDDEVVIIANWIRNNWGNRAPVITMP